MMIIDALTLLETANRQRKSRTVLSIALSRGCFIRCLTALTDRH